MAHKKTKDKKAKNTADVIINNNISDTEKRKNDAIVSDNNDKKNVCDTAENSNCSEENKKDTEEKSENKLIESLKFFATVIIPICSVVWAFFNIVADLRYKRSAADFYGISDIYFTYDSNIVMLYTFIIIILLLITYDIFFYRFKFLDKSINFNLEDKILLYGLVICDTLLIFLILLASCNILYRKMVYIHDSSSFNPYDNIFNLFLVSAMITVIFGISMFLIVTLNDSSKKSRKIVTAVMTIISIMNLVFFSTWALPKIFEFPTEKERNFEFVTTNNTEYVVITHYEDEILVVPYQCNDDGEYIFYTKNYSFLKPDECTFSYIKLEHLPIIDKE